MCKTRRSASSACACVGAVEAIHVHTSSLDGSIVAHSLNDANARRLVAGARGLDAAFHQHAEQRGAGLVVRGVDLQHAAQTGDRVGRRVGHRREPEPRQLVVEVVRGQLAEPGPGRGLVTRASSGDALLEQGFFVNG